MQIGIAKATLQAHMATSFFLGSLRLLVELSRFGTLLFENKANKTFYLEKLCHRLTFTTKQISNLANFA